jgi:hypothetical protein
MPLTENQTSLQPRPCLKFRAQADDRATTQRVEQPVTERPLRTPPQGSHLSAPTSCTRGRILGGLSVDGDGCLTESGPPEVEEFCCVFGKCSDLVGEVWL